MRTISEMDLRRRPASVLRAIERGEEVTITRDGQPFARLVPATTPRRRWTSWVVPDGPHIRPDDADDVPKRIQVRPKKVVQPVAGLMTPDDLEDLLKDVKVRREELLQAMESAKEAETGAQ